jgi:hypothetical protein
MEKLQKQLKEVLNSLSDIKERIAYCENDIFPILEEEEDLNGLTPKLNIELIESLNQDAEMIKIEEARINSNGTISIMLSNTLGFATWDIEFVHGDKIGILNTVVYDVEEFNKGIFLDRSNENVEDFKIKTCWFDIGFENLANGGFDYRVFKDYIGNGYEILLIPDTLISNYGSDSRKLKF